MVSLIIGLGEVGSSLKKVLEDYHTVYARDLEPVRVPKIDIMHICLRYSSHFETIVDDYAKQYKPRLIDICTTVPPGTTSRIGRNAVHSTTRGLHPDLVKSIRTFVKHIGGQEAREVAKYYEVAGIKTQTHSKPETTELAHILSNSTYGINLIWADEMASICRQYGVDYTQAVLAYNSTCNEGYFKLDHASKYRMLLNPPQGKIGGHCVRQGAALIPEKYRTEMLNKLVMEKK